ncbi:MAG: FGGY-family carbohydrate kinase [Lachnospiraceae bacterium]|nr:FGGY-family carbohydrate kinase [Lachnospiraceae bacterium]MDD6191573.1 FGGY-family carbohydrate kinase [Lachnospiraceae bacterium]
MSDTKELIANGEAILGIEFGSTRIKAVLIDENHKPIASGDHIWENRLENGFWTYHEDEIWSGLQDSYANLKKDVESKYGVKLTKIAALGFSAMMHGYLAFDKEGKLLVPFRTWRNSTTGEAAEKLSALFEYNIPERWSISHLYQAILNGEDHVKDIAFFTTLAGFIHWKLTGEKVLGVGDASGMFPIDPKTKQYDATMIEKFENLIAEYHFPWKLTEILPEIRLAGEAAGTLTETGAKLLDPSGELEAGVPIAPPEGDAGTGMVATNSVKQRTGNVSAGTSVFAMVVLDKELSRYYPQIDMVTTPDGSLVAMVHANNCTSDLNAWVGLCGEVLDAFGVKVSGDELYGTLYRKSLEADPDCGGLLSYGFLSGENIMNCVEGRPMFVRTPESKFTLANFMRSHLYASFGALKVGMDLLLQQEKVEIDAIYGHGGIFKTKGVAQNFLAAALNTPVSVMETAGEGGPWGMAVLAAYLVKKAGGESLEDYLADKVFADAEGSSVEPDAKDVEGFNAFATRFKDGIAVEQTAVEKLS